MAIHLRGLTWDDPRGRGPTQALAEAFAQTEAGSGVTIEWAVQPLGSFESASVVEIAERFDVMIIDHPHVIEAASARALEPIEMEDDRYIGPCLASYQWQGQQWAVPVDAASHVTAYREDRIVSPPATWAEFFDQFEQGLRFGLPLRGVHALMALLTLVASMGAPFDAEAAEQSRGAGFPSDADLTEAARLLQRIASASVPESLEWNPLESLSSLARGDCDCLPLTFGYAHFQSSGVRFAPIPTLDSHAPACPILGGTGMAVSARRPHAATAQALARFSGSAEVQAGLWPKHGGQPAHLEAWRRLGETDPFYRDTSSSMAGAYLRPRCLGWNRFQSTAGDAINHWLADRANRAGELVSTLRRLWIEATNSSATALYAEGRRA